MNQLGSRLSVISKVKQTLAASLIIYSATLIKKNAVDRFPEEGSAVSFLMRTHRPRELRATKAPCVTRLTAQGFLCNLNTQENCS